MNASEQELDDAVQALRAGGLVVFPTETVYGVGASARDAAAIGAIFEAKGRPPAQAMTVHLGVDADPGEWAVEVPPAAERLMDECWPGPLTIVLRSRPDVPDVIRGGGPTVGLRVPDHPLTLELFRRFGDGVVATSANRHGAASPTTVVDAQAELAGAVSVYLDGGPCSIGIDSTVIDVSGDRPVVLRVGSLPVERIESIGGVRVEVAEK